MISLDFGFTHAWPWLEVVIDDIPFHKLIHIDLLYLYLKVVFKEKENTNRFLLIFSFLRSILITIQGTYDIVDVVWKLGSYIKVEVG